MKAGYVYVLASRKDGAIYVGVTSDLIRRVHEHKHSLIKGHTSKYNIKRLVYYEAYDDIETAISREKRIKKYTRQWKINLIEEQNPQWEDLYESLLGP